jgi:hypothetical protein
MSDWSILFSKGADKDYEMMSDWSILLTKGDDKVYETMSDWSSRAEIEVIFSL